MESTLVKGFFALAVSVVCVLIVWGISRNWMRADLALLRWHWRNLRRTVFAAKDAKRRRDMIRTYKASAVVIDQFGSYLATGAVADEDRDLVLLRLGEARQDLLTVLARGTEEERIWLAEHIRHGELAKFSGLDDITVARLKTFLESEIDVLSDAPHAVDGHTLRLAQFVLIRRS